MQKYIAKEVPTNWYRHDVIYTLKLMSTYIDLAEEQATSSIERFENNVEIIIQEELNQYQAGDAAQTISEYRGLRSDLWNLDGIFIYFYPNLLRRSSLLSLIGIFEKELNDLCKLFKTVKQYQIDIKDLNGMGMERASLYLEKIACIDVCRSSKEWGEIKNIQKIRNIVAHRNGSLLDNSGKEEKSLTNYINTIDSLEGGNELFIKEGFLGHVLSVYSSYFKLLDESIYKAEYPNESPRDFIAAADYTVHLAEMLDKSP